MVENAKKLVLVCLGAAYQRFLEKIDQEQEVLAGITDLAMTAFAMESVTLRAQKLVAAGKGETARDMSAVFLRQSMDACEQAARTVLSGCVEGDNLRVGWAAVRRLAKYSPVDLIALRRKIAGRMLAAGRYVAA